MKEKKIRLATVLAEAYSVPPDFYYTAYKVLAEEVESGAKFKYTAVVTFHYLECHVVYSFNASTSRLRDIMAGNNESVACDAGDWIQRLKKEGKLDAK